MMASSDDSKLRAVTEWFADRGFGLKLMQDEGNLFWADLTRLTDGQIVAPKFGHGETHLAAASRAKQRYEQEQ
jgi:hypothetical protein